MLLHIDTANGKNINIALKRGDRVLARKKISAERRQSEKLLPLIDKILKDNKKTLKDIKKIEVVNSGGTFTSLRIGVVAANALGYALGVPVRGVGSFESAIGRLRKSVGKRSGTGFDVVRPAYDKEPNIVTSKRSKTES